MTASAAHAPGTVYLVGAGPGDPGLFTIHGAEALAGADVVVYDRLADNSLLELAPADAELVYVGKQAAVHAVPQWRINELLVEFALQGKCVVRLKGGDPFVFGRGGEEATKLREHGVPFVVVPGVSSSVAAPAYAGIPVTDRRYASSFSVITGHEDPTKAESRIDWAGIAAGADTLVFLMGLANLPRITERLIAEGRSPETPVAVIERGTTPGQRVVTAKLETIDAQVREAGLHPPAMIVVGDVVELRQQLAWYDAQPLAGRRVLVPRVRRRPSEIVRLLKAAGAEAVEVPVLRSMTLAATPDLLERLTAADWLVFTSPFSLDALLEQLAELGRDVRALGEARLAAVGAATAAHLRRFGLLAEEVSRIAGAAPDEGEEHGAPSAAARVVILGEEGGDVHLAQALAERGLLVSELAVSRVVVDDRSPLPDIEDFDGVALASSGTARRLCELYPEGPTSEQVVVSIGPSTSATARDLGIRVSAEAEEATPAALAAALFEMLKPSLK